MRYLTLLALFACKGEDTSPPDTDPVDTDVVDTDTDGLMSECFSLEADECAANADCRSLRGQPIRTVDGGGFCLQGTALDVACIPADLQCPGVPVWASPTVGVCDYFPSGCSPAGWHDCPAEQQVTTPCEPPA